MVNVVSEPELNGRTGKVVRAAANDDSAARIGVLVDGMGGPIRLKPNCIAIKQRADHARPYSSLEALLKKHTTFDAADKEADLEESTAISVRCSFFFWGVFVDRFYPAFRGYGARSLLCLHAHALGCPRFRCECWNGGTHGSAAGNRLYSTLANVPYASLPVPLHASLPTRLPRFPPSFPPLSASAALAASAPSEERSKAACGQPVGRADQGDCEHAVGEHGVVDVRQSRLQGGDGAGAGQTSPRSPVARGHVCMTTSPPNLPFCRRRFKLQHCSESLHDFRTPQKDLCLAGRDRVAQV